MEEAFNYKPSTIDTLKPVYHNHEEIIGDNPRQLLIEVQYVVQGYPVIAYFETSVKEGSPVEYFLN